MREARRAGRWIIAALVLTGVAGACSGPTERDSVTETGPGAGELRPVARIAHELIGECSGIVHHDGAFWVHNDSGDEPVLYRSTDLGFADATVLPVPGAEAVDWEEITVYEGDLLVCDIGDNRRQRDDLRLYRVRYTPSGSESPGRVTLVAAYPIRYPDGRHDAEACFVIDGRVHIVGKDRGEGTGVYRFDALESATELGEGGVNVPGRIGTLDLESGEMVTAGAYDEKSGTVVLLTYSALLLYPKDGLNGPPGRTIRTWARQSEAVCFCGDKLIIANEERDVFVVGDFLQRDLSELLPPRGSLNLAAASMEPTLDAGGAGWSSAAEIPLHNAREGEWARWLLADGEILVRGRFDVDGEFDATRPGSSVPAAGVLLMFARTAKTLSTEDEIQLAVVKDPSGSFSVRRLRILESDPHAEAFPGELTAGVEDDVFSFELSLPVSAIFGAPVVPERFRFDLRTLGLHETDDAYFSGPGFYSVQRPYTWGEVVVEGQR
jgi:hypothetical protein